jgi:ferredoxin-type protein NapH
MTRRQIRHVGIQVVRRCVQLSIVALVFGLVFLSLYAHYRAARALDDAQYTSGVNGSVIGAIDRGVGGMERPQEFLDGNKGTLWSMRVGGVDLTDPLAAAEMMSASKTVYVPIILSALLPLIATLLLGRVFCSWICPAGLLFEITGKLRKLLRFAELPPPDVKFSHRNKYMLLAVGLVVVAVVGLPVFAMIYPPAVISRLVHAWIFGTALTGMLALLALIVLFEVAVSPRWWCRTMCPGGALYALAGWPRLLRVKLDPLRCTGCKACIPVCEPGINPILQSDGIECDNCGVCIRHCGDDALFYTLGLPGKRSWSLGTARRSHGRGAEAPAAPENSLQTKDDDRNARSRSGRKLTVVGPLLVVALLLPARAGGHHILGLPHYSYKENYPQAPTLEYPATTGPYDVLLTSYPGKPVPGESANLAFYIKNRDTGRPFDRPISVRVLQTFTFGRNREVLPATVVQPFEVPHKLSATFPSPGEYVVELSVEVEGRTEVIPFMMVAGDPTATGSILAAVGAGLGLFVVVVRAIKIKRARRVREPRAPARSARPGRAAGAGIRGAATLPRTQAEASR